MSYSNETVSLLVQAIQAQAETTAQLVDAVIRLTEIVTPEAEPDPDDEPTQYLSGKPINAGSNPAAPIGPKPDPPPSPPPIRIFTGL